MCNIRKHPSWRTALPTRPQHPSSHKEGPQGLQPSMQGLSDLSQRCHPAPEHTQHTPPWHPEHRRAPDPSAQLRAVWHHGLRSHLQPQELLLAPANLQPTPNTDNRQVSTSASGGKPRPSSQQEGFKRSQLPSAPSSVPIWPSEARTFFMYLWFGSYQLLSWML